MRASLRLVLVSLLLAGSAASLATAATIQDLVKLKAAGLSDDILIALIESDGSVFHLKADDVIAIRKEGLSEKVIMAMLTTAIKRPPATPAAPATPAVAPRTATPSTEASPPIAPSIPVGDQYTPDQTTQIHVPPSPAPVVINVTQKVEQKVEAPRGRESDYTYPYPYYTTPSYYVGVPVLRPAAPPPQTVYWGFGGQRRPGSWKD